MNLDNLFGPERAYLDVLRTRQVFHFGYPPLLKQLQGEQLAELLRIVGETGVMVTLDTTPIANDTSLYEMLAPALSHAHIFTPNIEEAAQVAGLFTRLAERAEAVRAQSGEATDIEAVIRPEELQQIGEFILATGVPIVVITLGPNGAYLCTGDAAALRRVPLAPQDLTYWTNQRCFLPAFQVDGPVNTTGAGDTFIAGMLAGICLGLPSLPDIARLAHAAGALAVDLSRSYHSYGEVQAALPTLRPHLPKNRLLREMISPQQ
jgi:sugar/nucleoside kinase (ribokinase family)